MSSALFHLQQPGYDQDRQDGGGKRMKKRGASEYITKEHGSLENRDAADDPPKMSTAAQMARRKIATPKSRTGRSTTPTLPSNPFPSMSQPQQQQQQQQQQATGFQFGNANQSFPPTNPQSQSFQFSVPSTSSSFTFGQAENNQPQPASNPFASMNGATGAFGSQHVNNTDMHDSTTTQPAPSSSIFNFSTTQAAPSAPTNGFSFGQSTTQPQNAGFSVGGFGQQSTQPPNANPGLFGQSTNAQQNGFTPSFGQNKRESSPSAFGQPPTSSAPSFTGFGSSTSPAPTPTFSFGKTAVTQPPLSQTTESINGRSKAFNTEVSQTEPASAPQKPAFSLGQPATTQQSENQNISKPAFAGFGQPSTAQQPAATTSSSLFSGFGSSKPADSSSSQQSPNLFGQAARAQDNKDTAEKPDSTQDQEGPKNPFSSLFGGQTGKSTASAESPKPAKSPFQFGQSTTFTPNANQSSDTVQSTNGSRDQSPVSTDGMLQSKDSGSNTGLFSSKPTTAPPAPSGSLFNLNKSTTSAHQATTSAPGQAAAATPKSLFSFTPQKSAETASTPTPTFFNFGSKAASSPVSEMPSTISDDASPPKKRLFQGSSTPDAMAQSALGTPAGQVTASTGSNSMADTQVQFKPLEKAQVRQEPVTRAVSTEGPPQIPRFLSGEKYKVYDESWRLKALNRRFKDVISGLDADNQDFMNIVQNYLDHREAIGEGLAGYERKKLAGTKRKAVDVDDMQIEDAHSKRTKPTDLFSAIKQPVSSVPSAPKAAASTANNIFSANATPKPAASFTPAKTVADTQTSNIFKSMIPNATSNTTATSSVQAFAPARSTTPPSSPPKSAAPQLPKFEVPKFGGTGASNNFMSAFAQSSAASVKKLEQAAKEKRKAEEFDSDEDDEEEWNKKYEEEQRAKKAKIDAVSKASLAIPAFIPSASSSRSNSPFAFGQPIKSIETNGSKSPEPSSQFGFGASKSNAINLESGEDTSGQESGNSGDDEADHIEEEGQHVEDEQEDDDDEDEAEEIPDIPPEESLFSRISGKEAPKQNAGPILQPAANNSFKPGLMFGNMGRSTPEQPAFSPFTPSSTKTMPKGDFVPTTKFNFTPAPATSAGPVYGSTMLGGPIREGPIPGEGLFGSRPSTPSNADANKPFFSFGSSTSKQASDNTYKPGTPVKFGVISDTSAPSLEVTAATPPGKDQSKPFAGLFGQSSANSTSTNGASLGFNFGNPSSNTQPAPGYLSAASHLGGVSGTSSRATSPGIVSEAESVATDNTEDYSQEPQTSLMASNSGEENEDVIYDAKAALSRMYKESEIPEKSKIEKGWNKMGSGIVKVLKDKTTGKARIVFRAEPGANVILNTRLVAGGTYRSQAAGRAGAVTFPVATDNGMQMWMIRVKTLESAEEAVRAMETNKDR